MRIGAVDLCAPHQFTIYVSAIERVPCAPVLCDRETHIKKTFPTANTVEEETRKHTSLTGGFLDRAHMMHPARSSCLI